MAAEEDEVLSSRLKAYEIEITTLRTELSEKDAVIKRLTSELKAENTTVQSLETNNKELKIMFLEAQQNDERSKKLLEAQKIENVKLEQCLSNMDHQLSVEKSLNVELQNKMKRETEMLVSSSSNRVQEISEEHEKIKRMLKEEHCDEISKLCLEYDKKLDDKQSALDISISDLSDLKLRLEESHKRGIEVVADQEAQIRSLQLENQSLDRRLKESSTIRKDLRVRLDDSVSRTHFRAVQGRLERSQVEVDQLTTTLRGIQLDKHRDCRGKWI